MLSKHVYGGKYAKEVGDVIGSEGFKVSSLTIDNVQLSNSSVGFKSQLCEADIDGQTQYVYAFAGTEDVTDWYQDIVKQPQGTSEQYAMAVQNAELISKKVGINNLTFVSHSLGGGLAQATALKTGGFAMTYIIQRGFQV